MDDDAWLANLDVFFRVPDTIEDPEVQVALSQLAATLKRDLREVRAPVEVVMAAVAVFCQFVKHWAATGQPYGVEGYDNPGQERAVLSSLHGGLSSVTEQMAKLRVRRADPQDIQAAVSAERLKFRVVIENLFRACGGQAEPLAGPDLLQHIQLTLLPIMQEQGLM